MSKKYSIFLMVPYTILCLCFAQQMGYNSLKTSPFPQVMGLWVVVDASPIQFLLQ